MLFVDVESIADNFCQLHYFHFYFKPHLIFTIHLIHLSTFSFLVRALDLFLAQNANQLPLSGTIPDLTATTEQYVLLQQAYQAKAKADLDQFTQLLHGVLEVDLLCDILE